MTKKIQTDKNWLVQLPNRTLVGFTFWTFRPIDYNHPHGENSVAAITFPEKYVHLILHLFMDIYVPHFIQQGCQNVENSQTHWKRVIIYLGKIGGAHVPCHFAKWQCNVCFFTFDVINFCSSTQSRFFNFIHRYFSEI